MAVVTGDRGPVSRPLVPPRASSSRSQLSSLVRFCEQHTGQRFVGHSAFHAFSVEQRDLFWSLLLSWSRLVHDGSPEPVCTSDDCESARFFPNLRLNYAENLLSASSGDDDQLPAVAAHSAYGDPVRLTRGELRSRVLRLAARLRAIGVGPGDRVVTVAGNNAEALIAGLAAASVGAVFSSASPEMGVGALLSRFAQLQPSVLVANLLAHSAGGRRELCRQIAELIAKLPSLKALVALDDGPEPQPARIPVIRLAEALAGEQPADSREWLRMPFNHPLFILFTSGTTGHPKCLMHGAGGTLLEHVKEHRLHVDLRPGERLFFHTTTAWMMWNWQLSALASGAELVLFDGPVTGPETLWEIARAEDVNVFGTSPPYLQLCEESGYEPGPLPGLRTVLSTGSILHDWQYDWLCRQLGPVAVQSISGGTDIIGCFVLGNPELPVRRGMIQCRSLGMDVQSLSGADGPVGELICRNPFPSRPLGFFGDAGSQFHAAYFEQNQGVWTHGDLIEFDADGQARMHGRSDGVLNIGGVRIGPAEIYRALHDVDEVAEAMAVELTQPDGQGLIALLVVLRETASLDPQLTVAIRRAIATGASAAHVPGLIVQVPELPVTHSGKRSERAARDVINGRPVSNPEALANPQSLERIRAAVDDALARRRRLEAAAARADPTEGRVLAIWEATLGIPLGPDDNFFELGGTSLIAVRLLQAILERIGIELAPSVFLYAQTPAQMAALIDGPLEQRAPILVPLRGGSDDRPVFIVHALAGDVLHVRPLALALDTERPVYGLQARGLDPRFSPQTSVEEMARTYVEVVRSVQPHGPYSLGGYSFGGLVAFEMARLLRTGGEPIDTLALFDSYLHPDCLPENARLWFTINRPYRYLRYALGAPRTRVPDMAGRVLWRIRAALARRPQAPPPASRGNELERIGRAAFRAYRPQPYDGTATLFRAESIYPAFCNPAAAWPQYVRGGLQVHNFTGDHGAPVTGETVTPFATRFSELLRVSAVSDSVKG